MSSVFVRSSLSTLWLSLLKVETTKGELKMHMTL